MPSYEKSDITLLYEAAPVAKVITAGKPEKESIVIYTFRILKKFE
jgi:hypothetical protein